GDGPFAPQRFGDALVADEVGHQRLGGGPRGGEVGQGGGQGPDRGGVRRRADDDDGVDVGIGQQDPQGGLVGGRIGRGHHVDRVADSGRRGQAGPQRLLGGGRQLRHFQPGGLAGVGGEHAGAARIPDDGHPAPGGQGLVGQHGGGVEELLHGVDPDHAGLAEQGVDGPVGAGQGGGVGRRPPASGRGPAALDGDDRL